MSDARVPEGHGGGRMMVRGLLLAAALSSALPAVVEAQSLLGRIRDELTGDPIEDARVQLDSAEVAVSGAAGVFEFLEVPAGTHHVRVERLGYEPLDTLVVTQPGVGTFLDVMLGVDAIALAPIEVYVLPREAVIDLVDLRHRLRLGLGSFVTADEIAERGSPPVPFLVRALPSIRMVGGTLPIFRGAATLGGGACPPIYYLDGMKMRDFSDVQRVPTTDIALIEGYAGAASVPGEFSGSDARCGVIAIWTNRGTGVPLSALVEAWKRGR